MKELRLKGILDKSRQNVNKYSHTIEAQETKVKIIELKRELVMKKKKVLEEKHQYEVDI